MASQHLLFDASDLLLAAPADLVKRIHDELSVQRVAGTQEWFRGLAVAHGKLLPVTDLGAFCGRRASTGRTLELSASAGNAGLQVDTVHGLSDTPVTDVPFTETDDAMHLEERLALSARAIVHGSRVHRLVDIAELVQSPAFLTIAESNL